MKKTPAIIKLPPIGGLTRNQWTEFKVNSLRQEASMAMVELCELQGASVRDLVVKRMVALAIEACGHVAELARTDSASVKKLASGLTMWPINYSSFPGDSEHLELHLNELGFASQPKIRIRKWRLTTPGTRFAYAYWYQVNLCKMHAKVFGKFSEDTSESVKLFNGVTALRKDASDAISLPRLVQRRNVLCQWELAYRRHLERHYPGSLIIEHPDWKRYFAKSKKASVGALKSKVLEEVAKGFLRIAPQE